MFLIPRNVNGVVVDREKFCEKCWKDPSPGDNDHDTSPISLIKSYGFYFRLWEVFRNKNISQKKTTKKLPQEKLSNFPMFTVLQIGSRRQTISHTLEVSG